MRWLDGITKAKDMNSSRLCDPHHKESDTTEQLIWSDLMDTLSLTKEARIYNGEKTISLTSGAGKTGQPLVKE